MPFKYQTMYKKTKPKHVQIQILVGSQLFHTIKRAAAKKDKSRNTWIMNAINNCIKNKEKIIRYPLKTGDFYEDRRRIIMKIKPELLTRLNDRCYKIKCRRSTYIIDAIITALAKQKVFIDKTGYPK